MAAVVLERYAVWYRSPSMRTRVKSGLIAAMAAYAALATLSTLTLSGKFRIAVWIFLGGMAVKTWLSSLHPS
jgi:hypothetical protein